MIKKYLILHIMIVFLVPHSANSQNKDLLIKTPEFERIYNKEGLPGISVKCMIQDHFGYLWLGTFVGLVRYDGYSMEVFRPSNKSYKGISGGIINTIYEDNNNILWVGTGDGLKRFDRTNNSFKTFRYNPDDSTSINNNRVTCIYEDKSGEFWVGTYLGLNLFDRTNGKFTRYYFTYGDSILQGKNIPYKYNLRINGITQDPVTGNLLIGTEINGLWKFDPLSITLNKYKSINAGNPNTEIGHIQNFYISRDKKVWMASSHTLTSLDPRKREVKSYIDFPLINKKGLLGYNPPGSVIEDQQGLIWCGFISGEKGIFCLNPRTGKFQQYKLHPGNVKYSIDNEIYTIYEDRSGIIWFGTWGFGLFKWDKRKNLFGFLKNDPTNTNSLSSSSVNSVTSDPRGYIWFSTPKGLDRYDEKNAKFQHYLQNVKCITSSTVYSLALDKSHNIWMGTTACGLLRFNPSNGSYRFFCNNPSDSINLVNKAILSLLWDDQGVLWIGSDGYGLFSYDPTMDILTQYKHNPNDPFSISTDEVINIAEDSSGTIWVGTNLGGLNKFDRKTKKFTHCGSFGNIIAMKIDKRRGVWIADLFTGLTLYDGKNDTVLVNYNHQNGLASDVMCGIMQDDYNNIWAISDVGVIKVDTKKKRIKNYLLESISPNVDFFYRTTCTARGLDGTMYFITRQGFVVFHPDSIKDDPTPPQVVISGVSLFNRTGTKLKYEGYISELKEITLPYNQNDLRFDYVGLQYSEPLKNQYKYKLENFDNDWIDAGNQRNATYTNLDPGEYVFKVMAANRDGVWNNMPAYIKIIITSPWWETWWAYSLYGLFFLSILYGLRRYELNRLSFKNQVKMDEAVLKEREEMDRMKSNFFANISHEFRTPLTLILGPVKQIVERIKDDKTKEELKIVHNNAGKLLGLVNQLLDLSKVESGNMKLRVVPQNIVSVVKVLIMSFSSYAERKRITLKFSSPEEEIITYIDKEKMEKIITNILSNAFKFTPEGGHIEVSVGFSDTYSSQVKENKDLKVPSTGGDLGLPAEAGVGKKEFVQIAIRDSGIGIPEEKIPKVFDRFYQVDGSIKREQEGTGIGLSLTKELVELHKGKIRVESREGEGTTVLLRIPLGKKYLKQDEIFEEKKVSQNEIIIPENGEEVEKESEQKFDVEFHTNESKPLLLIVEDNIDVRKYIKDNLTESYRTLEAINGKDGWEKSIDKIPDLIISDVMMPEIDGFMLCEKLKTEERTSHIPVILLTAKAAKQDKIEGYETGADDYIMKPFEPDELKARVKNLIEQRKRIHEHFRKEGILELEKTEITSIDKKFLRKAFDVVNNHLSNSNFNLDLFAEKLTVSRSVLYRKIVSLTGEAPGELIRRLRIKKAADLIEQKFGNLSEIALEVGFSNPAYFSEAFTNQFGITPSQYKRKITQNL